MQFSFQDYQQSADFIKAKLKGFQPEALLVLGSGLGFLGDVLENPIVVPYGEIPNFKVSTAPGHKGQFVFGLLGGKNVVVMQGRMHIYEGYSAEDVVYPVRVCRLLGATTMIVTNACGGVNEAYEVGELMLITDFIKTAQPNPLIGPNIPEFGPRFCDMSYTFSKAYRGLAKEVASEMGLNIHEGVYYYTTGPQYETPAEIRAFRILGADVVGMSTVPESLAANHAGMKILGISLVTNMAAGILDQPLTEKEVLDAAEAAKEPFSQLIIRFLEKME
ncbi:MAG: purine-nucleoside phosphorylase [Clostridia bacterium]